MLVGIIAGFFVYPLKNLALEAIYVLVVMIYSGWSYHDLE